MSKFFKTYPRIKKSLNLVLNPKTSYKIEVSIHNFKVRRHIEKWRPYSLGDYLLFFHS